MGTAWIAHYIQYTGVGKLRKTVPKIDSTIVETERDLKHLFQTNTRINTNLGFCHDVFLD